MLIRKWLKGGKKDFKSFILHPNYPWSPRPTFSSYLHTSVASKCWCLPIHKSLNQTPLSRAPLPANCCVHFALLMHSCCQSPAQGLDGDLLPTPLPVSLCFPPCVRTNMTKVFTLFTLLTKCSPSPKRCRRWVAPCCCPQHPGKCWGKTTALGKVWTTHAQQGVGGELIINWLIFCLSLSFSTSAFFSMPWSDVFLCSRKCACMGLTQRRHKAALMDTRK